MNSLPRVEASAGTLKVFPLPSVVLFPGAIVPLHIFEPRYRALVGDCLAGDKVMALAGLEPGWESDSGERPRMRPLCCAGVIAWHEELPEGRFNIILQGVVRARILKELPGDKPYREVQAQLLPDSTYQGPEEELLKQALLDVSGRIPPEASQSLLQLAAHAQGGALADLVGSSLIEDLDRRQELLCELDVRKRLQGVLSEITDLMARSGPTRPQGPLN